MVRGRSLLPPAGHIGELHQRLDLIFKSDQGYLFSAILWVKHCRAGVLNCGRFAAPSPLGAFGGVWRQFWLSLLGTGATGLQWVEVRAADQLLKGMRRPPKKKDLVLPVKAPSARNPAMGKTNNYKERARVFSKNRLHSCKESHSFNKHLPNTCYLPKTVLGSENISVGVDDKIPAVTWNLTAHV